MGRHIVSFSTGIPSAIVAYLVCKQHPDAIVLFADVHIEDNDNYRFLKDVESLIGKKVHTVSGDLTPLEIAETEGETWIPNQLTATCTRKGKLEQLKAFAQEGDTMYIGMTHQDIKKGRGASPVLNWWKMGVKVRYPLLIQNIEPHSFAKKIGLVPPRMYGMGFTHANCGGCCVKQGRADWSRTLVHFPERYAYYEAWEQERIQKRLAAGRNRYTFVRKQVNGVNVGISLRELREEIEAKEQHPNFLQMVDEMNGYGCGTECGIGNTDELEKVFSKEVQ